MPNTSVPAAAEGVSANRCKDPLLAVIRAYQQGYDDFNVNAPKTSDDSAVSAYVDASYGPHLARLNDWEGPAGSMEGAVEALRLALNDTGGVKDTEAGERMVAAALAFLEKGGCGTIGARDDEGEVRAARIEAKETALSLIDLQDRLCHVRSLVTLVDYALEGMSLEGDEEVNALQAGVSQVYDGVKSAEDLLKSVRGETS
ncbi:hypothetical protein [Rhizobium leguminosarum]